MYILSSCILPICSCTVFLGSKVILCGPSDVHGSLRAKERKLDGLDLGRGPQWFGFLS